MGEVKVQFLGSGDAFGSDGRLPSCILIASAGHSILLDCGAAVMSGLNRWQVDPLSIEVIVLSNLHGDHCGGVPYFIIDAQLNRKRTTPLVIAGPTGLKSWFPRLMEITFPGSGTLKTSFPLYLQELEAGQGWQGPNTHVLSWPAIHAPGDPHLILRISFAGKTIAYSGDTEWTDNLVFAGSEANLNILESYFYSKKVKYHLDYITIAANHGRLQAGRVVITHMGRDMLTRLDQVTTEYADDGKVFYL